MHDSQNPQEAINASIERHRQRPGALLPILHSLQASLGYIPAAAITPIARALQQSDAEIKGVISFYHHFHTAAPGRHRLQLCRAEACQARGGRELERHARTQLGIDYHQTSADRALTLEPVYCLGNCACGPSIRLDNRVIGRVDAATLDRLLAECRHDSSEETQSAADPTQEVLA